ncbi:MAG TPA: hypothetical protein VMI73_25290 [Trebonia sp.]|nr:hypothetical protein [Trebonia sp.]
MNEPIEVVQGNDFSREFSWNEAEPRVQVNGPSNSGLKAVIRGGRLRLSGRLSRPGKHEITIVQQRTMKVTINVSQKKSILETPVLNVLMGKNVPLDPPANP